MTIKEFYEWAIEHGVENYDLHTEEWWLLRDVDIRINEETKSVII